MFLILRSFRFIFRQVSPFRFIGPGVTLAGLAALAFVLVTGRVDFSKFDLPLDADAIEAAADLARSPGSNLAPLGEENRPRARSTEADAVAFQPVRLDRNAARPNERIRIATFNIQRFGEKKSGNADVMRQLARIVASFDLVAIQEVQSPQAMPVARLVDLINRSGGRYEASVSEPIGRSAYREQYAFVWDTTRVRMIPDSAYVVRDDSNRMHRPPMVASFETRITPVPGRRPFRFTLINAHADPDLVSPNGESNEMDVLDDVFVRVREYEYQTRGIVNVILLGDLNVSTANLGELGQLPGMLAVVGTAKTNTLGTKTYDHILLDQNVTTEYTGVFGVVDYQQDFGLTLEQALMVSDHRPVWAEFSASEIPPVASATRESSIR